MTYSFISELSESRLLPSKHNVKKFTGEELCELALCYFSTLAIMMEYRSSKEDAIEYAAKTMRNQVGTSWSGNGTDLAMIMYALLNPDKVTFANDADSKEFVRSLNIDYQLIRRWIISIRDDRMSSSEKRRLFTKLDRMFMVKDTAPRAIRRIAMDYENTSDGNRKLAVTRLLQILRARTSTKSELLPHLERLAKNKKLEIKDAANQETGDIYTDGNTHGSLVIDKDAKKDKSGSGFLASLAGLGIGYMIGRKL